MAIDVTITIDHSEIQKRVRNKTNKLSKSSGIKDPRIASNLQADDTPQDIKIVEDAIENAVGEVISALSKYVSNTAYGGGASVVALLMPDTWRSSNAVGLVEDVYDYVTYMAMAEFLTNAGDHNNASSQRDMAGKSLNNAIKKSLDRKSPLS